MAHNPLATVLDHLRTLAQGAEPADALTDGQLLEQFTARHDRGAFELLLQRHAGLVWGVCCRVLRNQHDAEDAFQATWLVLARKAGALDRRGSVGGWLDP